MRRLYLPTYQPTNLPTSASLAPSCLFFFLSCWLWLAAWLAGRQGNPSRFATAFVTPHARSGSKHSEHSAASSVSAFASTRRAFFALPPRLRGQQKACVSKVCVVFTNHAVPHAVVSVVTVVLIGTATAMGLR